MKNLLRSLVIFSVAVGLSACGGGGTDDKTPDSGAGGGTPPAGGGSDTGTPPADTPPADGTLADGTPADGTPADAPPAAAGTGTVKGKVVLAGAAPTMESLLPKMLGDANCAALVDPANPPLAETYVTGDGGSLGNVLVYVSAGLQGRQPPGRGAVTFDQKGCIYTPHVIAIQVGQTVKITNSDKTLHNVHTRSKNNGELNRGQPQGSPAIEFKPKKPEVCISAKCDVHPWMNASIGVFDHPFFAVTGVDGTFTLPQKLAPGKYTLTGWHEDLGEVSVEVDVKDGDNEANLEFAAKG